MNEENVPRPLGAGAGAGAGWLEVLVDSFVELTTGATGAGAGAGAARGTDCAYISPTSIYLTVPFGKLSLDDSSSAVSKPIVASKYFLE